MDHTKKGISRTYFTSDLQLHFLHKKICDYTDRKLVTTQELHDQWLIDLWNSQVNKGDLIYCLGDVSFGKLDQTIEILKQLNGQIIVVKGNHDKREDLDKLKGMNLIANWHDYKEITIEKQSICLFHFPISAWHKQGYGSFHAYGHSHGTFQNKGLSLDVGIDSSYNYFGEHKLFTFEDIAGIMKTKQLTWSNTNGHSNYN